MSPSGPPIPDGPAAKSIANRLGWLDVPDRMQPELDRVEALADEVRRDGITTLYLLGMGGSSLCAEVMRAVYGVRDGFPHMVVMDTTDEAAITGALAALDPARTLFLVASKSGGTVEPASMEKLFWAHMSAALGAAAGRHFVAVTDPGTELAHLAQAARLPASLPQSARHRRALLRAVALRPRARRDHRRADARHARRRRRHGGRLPAGEPSERRARARRVHRRGRRRRPRQADRRCFPRRSARSASGSNSSSPRARANKARGRCRSSTSRSARRQSTAAIAASSRSPPIATRPTRRAWTRSRPPAIRCSA